jgi:hypothetical protein
MRHAVRTAESRSAPNESAVFTFVGRALGLRFEMRFEWESDWWPIDAQEVAETLSGYHDSLQRCLEELREGEELASGLAYYRVRR